MEIPNGPEALTPEWLTQALRQSGTITSANVLSFQTQTVGAEGEGISGQMVRVRLAYDLDELTAPQSLIAKFHAADLQTRTIANGWGLYANEFRFYQQVAMQKGLGLPIPCCYYSDYHNNGLVVLLLEDLAPARSMGSDMDSAQVELAICQIARFHAFWWEHPGLVDIFGVEDAIIRQEFAAALQHHAQDNWETFLILAGDNMPQPMIEIGQRIVNNKSAILSQIYDSSQRTFIHGDFHGDNLCLLHLRVEHPFQSSTGSFLHERKEHTT